MKGVYELQISQRELYAFEPLLCDTIHTNKIRIDELRRELTAPCLVELSKDMTSDDNMSMLIEIQKLEGKNLILQDLLDQLVEQGL